MSKKAEWTIMNNCFKNKNFLVTSKEEDYNSFFSLVNVTCPNKHNITVTFINFFKANNGCLDCVKELPRDKQSSGEKLIFSFLQENKDFNVDQEKRFLDSDVSNRRYDFYVSSKDNLFKPFVIEYDGRQHFTYIEYFHKTEENFKEKQEIDIVKTDYCINNEIPIIRLSYNYFDNLTIDNFNDIIQNFIKNDNIFLFLPQEDYASEIKRLS